MLAAVKKPHINAQMFEVKCDAPDSITACFSDRFLQNIKVVDEDETLVNIFETDWYTKIADTLTNGETVRIYRENAGFTQAELGLQIGKFTRQKISDIEDNRQSISKDTAKKLSKIFDVPVQRFLQPQDLAPMIPKHQAQPINDV
jgi:DNA-binding XRE family transcriptional regulator